MKRNKVGFEKDIPLALSVFVLWTTGVVIIPHLQRTISTSTPTDTLVVVDGAYFILYVITFTVAAIYLVRLLRASGFNKQLLRRETFLHMVLYTYAIAGVCIALYLIVH